MERFIIILTIYILTIINDIHFYENELVCRFNLQCRFGDVSIFNAVSYAVSIFNAVSAMFTINDALKHLVFCVYFPVFSALQHLAACEHQGPILLCP